MTQNTIQKAGKTIAGIFSSETQEHIISTLLGERGRGGSSGGRKGHCDFDAEIVEKNLKGRGEEKENKDVTKLKL